MIMDKKEREKQVLDLLMSRKDIRKLVEKSNECYSKMDFVGAMKYRQEIKDIVDRESKIMLTKSESLIGLMNNADNEYKFNMLVWLHSMMCMADVFNGILEDFKDGVRKANGNSKFVKFDTQIGVGEVIAISKTKETLMVKMDDGRECPIRLEYVKDVFDNYKSK